ncbi:hypothetical protein FB451DRAFT_1565871 [Mycena latifolia]|nr:hypothetical protein FB451DRAFT_1565871 [Mycena latifolia]
MCNKMALRTASCVLAAKKRTSAKFGTLEARVVPATQFRAAGRTFAASITSTVKGGTFALQPEGFYVTPDKRNAQLFGATFLASACRDKGRYRIQL